MRQIIAALVLAVGAGPAGAACVGTDLRETLPAAEMAQITAVIDALPYGRGNYWKAVRGDEEIHLVGTYHFDDPRHDVTMAAIGPALDSAKTLLVEATATEQAELQAEMSRRPDRLFAVSGPTLPERLGEADWQQLAKAMGARGVPAFLASKMQPWYVSMLLGVPACAMDDLQGKDNGLDARVIARATDRGVPVRALEPYDTVFTIFDSMSEDEQIELIRTTLAMNDQAADYATTLTEAYFDEDVRVTWELGRLFSLSLPGATPEKVDADIAKMEEALMNRRNRSWIPVIEDAATKGPVFAAFGALHLSGEDGVLNLLARDGWTVERVRLD
ncbi:MAG: TraB/GumN family protein [Rhodobacteraceae bacterium]|nr:TraB/GumN family protein [Paracoccaceae bacterium]